MARTRTVRTKFSVRLSYSETRTDPDMAWLLADFDDEAEAYQAAAEALEARQKPNLFAHVIKTQVLVLK